MAVCFVVKLLLQLFYSNVPFAVLFQSQSAISQTSPFMMSTQRHNVYDIASQHSSGAEFPYFNFFI